MFDKLIWKDDRVLLDELVFRLELNKRDDWELGRECFAFYKTKPLVGQYAKFFQLRNDFTPRQVVELGLFDGGSSVFWFELFSPQKHVGFDLTRREDSDYFKRYIARNGLQDRLKTYWGVDQGDARALLRTVGDEFAEPLDLVIDDASHFYQPTKASFETLFPLLRPGGLYFIEDWAWAHWPRFIPPNDAWNRAAQLTNLVGELIEATGTSAELISSVTVLKGFTVVERGSMSAEDLQGFRLQDHIFRRGQPPAWQRMRVCRQRVSRWLGRLGAGARGRVPA